MGHTQHERFVLRMMSALPIVRERNNAGLAGGWDDHVTSSWPRYWVNLCLLGLNPWCLSRDQIVANATHVPDEGHGSERGRGLDARCLAFSLRKSVLTRVVA